MTKVQDGHRVSVHYVGRLQDGTVFDSSEGQEPIRFTLGAQEVIPGFEEAVRGMEEGESRATTIPAEKAYGERRDDMVLKVERERLPPGLDPSEGDRLQMEQEGTTLLVTVVEADAKAVTLDANHPLAGQDLIFELEVVDVEG